MLLRLARQWVAGDSAEDGIKRAGIANSRGILGLLNLLGESIQGRDEVAGVIQEYVRLLDQIEKAPVNSQVSIKPTQMGMNIDFDYCLQNCLRIAEECKSHANNWLWIDMEDSPYTGKTIELYKRVLAKYEFTGLALQAYLRRTEGDLKDLLPLGAKIRLVKGAYNEPREIAFKDKKEIRQNYSRMLRILFSSKQRNFFAAATHDTELVNLARSLSRQSNVPFEFEMLMGVRDRLKSELVLEKFQVREYIPFGSKWKAYFLRRVREKKSNVLLFGRSIFSP